MRQTSPTRRRLRCPSDSVTIRQARRNFRQTVDRHGGVRKLFFSSMMASPVTVTCHSFAVRGLNVLFSNIQTFSMYLPVHMRSLPTPSTHALVSAKTNTHQLRPLCCNVGCGGGLSCLDISNGTLLFLCPIRLHCARPQQR